jgi:L-threonylcarbamoyladenylate synthase
MRIVEATLENIGLAAEIIRKGGLVAMPTETVYGIAVDVMNRDAVRRVFEAKERPADNPLIVHLSEAAQLETVAEEVPSIAYRLADRFWPGPLTMVLPKRPDIPYEVTGGLETVAIRQPRHPVALALIGLVGRPLAAPSANRFMHLSPTHAHHIDLELVEKLDMVLDGGPCTVGLESTVLDLTSDPPRILRPGGVSRGDIQAVLCSRLGDRPPVGHASPGMYLRHYAPQARLILVDFVEPEEYGLVFKGPAGEKHVKMPCDPVAYASSLYDALHRIDSFHPTAIYVERPPTEPAWEAVWDRLTKAGGVA